MKPTDELTQEHRAIEKMLDVLMKASDRLEHGDDSVKKAFVDAAEFLKVFAEQCHHGKEEKHLFRKMVFRGMSAEVGPIAAMLHDHDEGRARTKAIDELSRSGLDERSVKELLHHTREYVVMLRQHIQKEDGILYPMADKILTESDIEELKEGFREIEDKIMGPGVHDRYESLARRWQGRLA